MKIAVIFPSDKEHKAPMSITGEDIAHMREALPGCEIRRDDDGAGLISAGYRADVLVCWGTAGHCPAGDYVEFAADTLKWIHVLSSGVEGLMETAAPDIPGIVISSSKGIHGIPMANHVMAYVLSFMRRLPQMNALRAARRWERPMPDEATGKTLAILGVGNIGRVVAQHAKAFGMRTVGIKRHVEQIPFIDEIYPESETDRVLAQADFVLNLLPVSPATVGYMSAERFAVMKRGAYYINVGRGATADEAALIENLRSGHIAGAGLDVFEQEPLAADSPLWDMENVILTPHIAADSPLYMSRALEKFINDYPTFVSGKKLPSAVDLVARY